MLRALPDLIVARIAGDRYRARPHAKSDETFGIPLVHGADSVELCVGVVKEGRRQSRSPRRARGECRAHEAEPNAARVSDGAQRRPHIELREDERCRPQCIEGKAAIARRVERQIVNEVDVQATAEGLGARRKKRIRELHLRMPLAHQLQDWPCL